MRRKRHTITDADAAVQRLYASAAPQGECLIPDAAVQTPNGYSRIWVAGAYIYAHRIIYAFHRGPIPEGLQIDHLCRNRACIRIDHLEVVTIGENVRRGAAFVTHCPAGHPYDEANTYYTPSKGHRVCRACGAAHARKYRRERRAPSPDRSN